MGDSRATSVHNVVAGLLVEDGEVFLAIGLPPDVRYPNVWALPGGHIEQDETPPRALVGELFEELGILIPEPTDSACAQLRRPDFDCTIWIVTEWTGTPHSASEEHHDMRWWAQSAIGDLPLAVESDRLLLERAVLRVGE